MSQPESGLSFERLVFFSDAVFAIVITLLVLELKPPHLDGAHGISLNMALLALAPKFVGFVVSFLVIGLMWIEHHRIFRFIRDYDAGLLWRNLLLLMCVSFIPFPTALFSEYYWSRAAFILYAASFGAAGLAKLWVWQYASGKSGLVGAGADELTVRRISRRSLAVPAGCVAAILFSLVSIRLAPLGFVLIPLAARLLDPARGKARATDASPGDVDEAAA